MANNCLNCRNGEYQGREDDNIYCHYWEAVFSCHDTCSCYNPISNETVDDNVIEHIDDILEKFAVLDRELRELKERLKND